METQIKQIRNVEDCVGLVEGVKVKFGEEELIYAGITRHAPRRWEKDGRISHRMIRLSEQGEPIEYELGEWVVQRQISVENPLYYPYKEMLEEVK